MPTQPQYDVPIVGASIAGCAAATFFARAGARVALIERDRDPAGSKVARLSAAAKPTCLNALLDLCAGRMTRPIDRAAT
jgi:flavin-dependent dehydrogenase